MRAGVAAGHPATVDAGIEILEAGGTAADAAVAACLASCVAETLMTGLLGGGHAIYCEPGDDVDSLETLDFFVAVPGLGATPREPELVRLEVPFGDELVHYAIGIATCGVPGVPAGLARALGAPRQAAVGASRRARAAARSSTACRCRPRRSRACAMLEPVMTMREGGRDLLPGRRAARGERDRCGSRGSSRRSRSSRARARRARTAARSRRRCSRLMEERGGLVTRADLEAYEARRHAASRADYAGHALRGRASVFDPLPVLDAAPDAPRRRARRAGRRPRRARSTRRPSTGTRRTLAVVDADGGACALTTSLGLGSGDWLPGLDLHLNSMLGEADLLVGPLVPGERMASMMAPTLAFDADGLALVAGSAGGTRLRGALVQVVSSVLDEGLPVRDRGRAAEAPPDRLDRARSSPASRRGGGRARGGRVRRSALGGPAPLLRRRQRDWAERPGRGPSSERGGARRRPDRNVLGQPADVAALGQPGFERLVLLGPAWRRRCRTRGSAPSRRRRAAGPCSDLPSMSATDPEAGQILRTGFTVFQR